MSSTATLLVVIAFMVIVLVILPFYAYVLGKFQAAGMIEGLKTLLGKKGKRDGEAS